LQTDGDQLDEVSEVHAVPVGHVLVDVP